MNVQFRPGDRLEAVREMRGGKEDVTPVIFISLLTPWQYSMYARVRVEGTRTVLRVPVKCLRQRKERVR